MMMSFSALPRLRAGAQLFLLLALACSPEQLSEPRGRAASIVVTPPTVTIVLDRTAQLNATVTDASGNTLPNADVFWSSADESIATVSRTGVVSARRVGETQIAASADGQSTIVRVTVTARPVKSVRVVPDEGQVRIGRTLQLTAVVIDESDAVVPDAAVTWSSDDPAIATVSATGLVQGVAPGTVEITVESAGKTATAMISVVTAPVDRIVVQPPKDTVEVADTVRLAATLYDEDDNVLTGRVVVWTSDNPQIATVDGNGLVRGVSPGTVTIRATSEGKTGTAEVTVVPIPVASVRITPNEATLARGDTLRLTATALDRRGAALPGRAVAWTTNAPTVATVSAAGLVTAVSAGVATISAEIEGKRAEARITVPAPVATSITVVPSAPTVEVGDSVQLSATVLDERGDPIPGASVTWSSSRTSVATVSNQGKVKGQSPGTATVTARSGSATGTADVTVVPVPVQRVEVTPASASVEIGETEKLTATAYDDAGNVLTGRPVQWVSSAPSVATVNSSGVVTGVSPGVATITAEIEGKTDDAQITVLAPVPTSVTIGPSAPVITLGDSVQLQVTVRDVRGNTIPDANVTWSTDDPKVATVSATGVVKAQGPGETLITARAGAASGTVKVTVPQPPPAAVERVEVRPATAEIEDDESIQLTATLYDANGTVLTGRVVTWSSNRPNVAMVNATGLVRGRSEGTATITATSEGKSGVAVIRVDD